MFNAILYKAYSKIDEDERKCLSSLMILWKKTKPFQGKKIILNCHLTCSTLIMIDVLLAAGAHVTVIATKDLVKHEDTIKTLKQVAIKHYNSLVYLDNGVVPIDQKENYYDVGFDCGAGLLKSVIPKYGMVELTYTDASIYHDMQYPVVSVDRTETKSIETYNGTGNAFVRLFKEYISSLTIKDSAELTRSCFPKNVLHNFVKMKLNVESLAMEKLSDRLTADRNEILIEQWKTRKMEKYWFKNRKYIIFGHGKVGRGIANALEESGVEMENIIVVETDKKKCNYACYRGYTAFLLPEQQNTTSKNFNLVKITSKKDNLQNGIKVRIRKEFSKEQWIEEYLQNAFCVVTATGVEGCISKYFDPGNFNRDTIKANMGTPDEWGKKFSENEILNYKKPANFLMSYPTKVAYLDAIFVSLLKGGECLISMELKEGFQPLDRKIDLQISNEWKQKYPAFYTTDIFITTTVSPSTSESDEDSSDTCSTGSNSPISQLVLEQHDKSSALKLGLPSKDKNKSLYRSASCATFFLITDRQPLSSSRSRASSESSSHPKTSSETSESFSNGV